MAVKDTLGERTAGAAQGGTGEGGAGPRFGPSPSPYLAPAADPGALCDGGQGLVSNGPKGGIAGLGTAPEAVYSQ